MSFADDFTTRWTGYAADSRRENALLARRLRAVVKRRSWRRRRGADAPPQRRREEFFMRDLDYMVEEMKIARTDGIRMASSTGGHADMGTRRRLPAPVVAAVRGRR